MWAAMIAALLFAPVPDPAPAQSRIVFASSRTTVSQLYSVEPSGEGLAQLTFGAAGFESPLASPDGRFIAAVRDNSLWTMRADGSRPRLLAPGVTNGFSWSTNSRQLVLANYNGAIWSVAVASGRLRRITRGASYGAPSLSPDGRAIAFLRCCDSTQTDGSEALVVRRNGREKVVLYGAASGPLWSPDGRWIAIATQKGSSLDLVRPSGVTTRVHVASIDSCWYCGTGGIAWSPDGRFLAFADGQGLHVVPRSGGEPRLSLKGLFSRALAWSPAGDALALSNRAGVITVTLDGETKVLDRFELGDAEPGVGWSPGQDGLRFRTPEEAPLLVQVSARELEARFPIGQVSADGDRIAYWICPHALGVWRPGDAQQVPLGERTLQACRAKPESPGVEPPAYELALAGDRLAYLTSLGGNEVHSTLTLATRERGTEGVDIAWGARPTGQPDPPTLTDVVGGDSTLVYGSRGSWTGRVYPPESIWRIDGDKPVQIASRPDDLQPLAVDRGRILARRADRTLDLLDLDGNLLATVPVAALGAALAGDDLVVLVEGELRNYSASTGELLHAWPLPVVPSSGRCPFLYCDDGVRLRLDDAARGLALYTLDGTVHLLRLRDGANTAIPGATVAELTDAGLFYAYAAAEPWPGRIRFVPPAELPL